MADNREIPLVVGYLLCDDLIFSSRIGGTARDHGLTIQTARTVEALAAMAEKQPPRCVFVDLAQPELNIADLVRTIRELHPGCRFIAYGSHVDAASLRRAREAGCDVVLPRSKFVEELPRALPDWIASPAPH